VDYNQAAKHTKVQGQSMDPMGMADLALDLSNLETGQDPLLSPLSAKNR
jgi:hypothetical protein